MTRKKLASVGFLEAETACDSKVLHDAKSLQGTTPVLLCTPKVILQYYNVLLRTTLYYKVLLHYYSKLLLQYYSVLLRTQASLHPTCPFSFLEKSHKPGWLSPP